MSPPTRFRRIFLENIGNRQARVEKPTKKNQFSLKTDDFAKKSENLEKKLYLQIKTSKIYSRAIYIENFTKKKIFATKKTTILFLTTVRCSLPKSVRY